MKCGHGKIPFGGHCAWTWCPNYRGLCSTHEYYTPGGHTKPCVPKTVTEKNGEQS